MKTEGTFFQNKRRTQGKNKQRGELGLRNVVSLCGMPSANMALATAIPTCCPPVRETGGMYEPHFYISRSNEAPTRAGFDYHHDHQDPGHCQVFTEFGLHKIWIIKWGQSVIFWFIS